VDTQINQRGKIIGGGEVGFGKREHSPRRRKPEREGFGEKNNNNGGRRKRKKKLYIYYSVLGGDKGAQKGNFKIMSEHGRLTLSSPAPTPKRRRERGRARSKCVKGKGEFDKVFWFRRGEREKQDELT